FYHHFKQVRSDLVGKIDFGLKLWQNITMYNWSVDEEKFKKEDPEGYKIWRLEQMINYGLGKEKISEKLVRKYWNKLFLDPETKRFLEFLLWPKKTRKAKKKS
ncbi:hypothetical protein J7K91_01930, partial [bacterium]|nr:hypothetical protein [bacterium]